MKIKRRTLELLKISAIVLGISVFLFGGVYGYFKTSIFSITTYDIKGLDDETRLLVESHLRNESQGKSLWVFPHNKIFTYSSSAITRVVREDAPDVASIEIHPVGLHAVRVTVTLLKPLFGMDEGKAITEEGIIFSTKKDVGMYRLVSFSTSTTGIVKQDGLPFTVLRSFDATFLQNIASFSEKVSEVIFPVRSIMITEEGDMIFFDENNARKVILLTTSDTKKAWSTLVSAIDTDPLKHKLKQEGDKLLYLDVRYGNKVFYKFGAAAFQNSTSTGIIDNHDSSLSASTTPSN